LPSGWTPPRGETKFFRPLTDVAKERSDGQHDNDLTLKAAALKLSFISEAEFDRIFDPKKMVKPYVAAE